MLAHGRNSSTSHQLTAADRSLLVLPIYHINAECVTLMPTLIERWFGSGAASLQCQSVLGLAGRISLHLVGGSADDHLAIAGLERSRRLASATPTFKRIRFIRSSSAPLSPSLQREFMDKFPIRLIQAMGSSEAGNIFSNPQAPGENKIGTPGLAWGFETRIVNPDGADVPRASLAKSCFAARP